MSNRHMTEQKRGGSVLTTDPACAAPGRGAESGDQPEERLKALATESGSKRPCVKQQRKRERQKGGKGKRETDRETDQTAQRKHSAHRPARASNGNGNDSNSSRSTPTSMVRQSTPS